jgi:hypothetical protein
LLNNANLTAWEPGVAHAELDRLTERIADILKLPAREVGEDGREEGRAGREDGRIDTRRGGRRPIWLAAGVAILLGAGAVYGAYMAGTWRQGSAGSSSASAAAVEKQSLEDLFNPLGLGLAGDGVVPMRAFELQDIGVHLVFLRPDQADASGLTSGAVVWRVEKGAAQAAGLQAGDVVMSINGRKISSENELRTVLRSIGPGTSRYLIQRGRERVTVDIDCATCSVS